MINLAMMRKESARVKLNMIYDLRSFCCLPSCQGEEDSLRPGEMTCVFGEKNYSCRVSRLLTYVKQE